MGYPAGCSAGQDLTLSGFIPSRAPEPLQPLPGLPLCCFQPRVVTAPAARRHLVVRWCLRSRVSFGVLKPSCPVLLVAAF